MPLVYVSLGSNQNKMHHISVALDELSQHFGKLDLSPVYESDAVGFTGESFLNSVAAFNTMLSIGELNILLKAIEDKHGRLRGGPKFSGRTLDIDILTYDDCVGDFCGVQLPRDEITKNAFVLKPLSDIAADTLHSVKKITYAALWQEYDHSSQKLTRIDFSWNGLSL
jgi:2-amino-4-hydroxy-6-hydroxymethyldihydropteridine diphosphokinase